MLVRIRNPKFLRTSYPTHDFFADSYSLKRVPLSKFIRPHKLAMLLDIPTSQVKNFLIESRSVYAYEEDDQIFIYPDSALSFLKKRFRRILKNAMTD